MHLDDFPELAFSRLVRRRARGVPIRDGGRAAAIAWLADGTLYPVDTIVRFDVAEGEKAPRRLADAFEQTNATRIRFFGGDHVVRGALRGLELQLAVDGAAFRFAHAPPLAVRPAFRPSTMRDSLVLGELSRELSAAFETPETRVAEIDGEPVGLVVTEEVDKNWTELRFAVHQPFRGRGYGAAIAATAADLLEAEHGRLVCAGLHSLDERSRLTLEHAGFRLVDYYFSGSRRV